MKNSPVSKIKAPSPGGIRKFSLYIISVLVLILSATFFYCLRMQSDAEHLLIDQEARAVTHLFQSMQMYMSQKQELINRGPDGSYHFKGLNPETVGREVADIFNRLSDHRIKITSLTPRNPANLPDEFERKALTEMQSDPRLADYSGRVQKNGETVFYFIKRMNLTSDCLECHGGPAGQPDLTGYPREGKKAGDFAGAISVQIPFDTLAEFSWRNTLILLLFTLGLAGVSIYLISYFLRKINALSFDLAAKNVELEQHNRRLEELEQLKGELFHMLVHDMKAPLTFMIGSLQMLEEQKSGPLNDEQADLIELVLRGCNRLEGMITNILDINRLEEGKLELSIAQVEPARLVQEREAVWQHTCRLQRKSLEITAETTRPTILTDRHLVERIVENLVSNAIKHTRPGTGKIRIHLEDWKGGAGILFRVSDNGEGIPESYRDKIFDKYTTAKQQDLGMKSDTGLGLTFCKMAVDVLGGEIWLESEPSVETSFCFYLPNETTPPVPAP